jgi:hypothetical protein
MRNAPTEPDSARTVRTSAVHFDGPAAYRPSALGADIDAVERLDVEDDSRERSLRTALREVRGPVHTEHDDGRRPLLAPRSI